MANVTLGTLRDYWKSVSDWVTGVATDSPSVQLSGRNVNKGTLSVTLPVTVTAGSGVFVYSNLDLITKYNHLSIGLKWSAVPSSWEMNIRDKISNGVAVGDNKQSYTSVGTGKKYELETSGVDIYIGNGDTVDRDISELEIHELL